MGFTNDDPVANKKPEVNEAPKKKGGPVEINFSRGKPMAFRAKGNFGKLKDDFRPGLDDLEEGDVKEKKKDKM